MIKIKNLENIIKIKNELKNKNMYLDCTYSHKHDDSCLSSFHSFVSLPLVCKHHTLHDV